MKMSEAISTIKEKVAILLNNHPDTRNSDKLLWLAYLCVHHDLIKILGQENYSKFKTLLMNDSTPTMESIRRVRQKYQEGGLFVGTNRKQRLSEEPVVRELMRNEIQV